MIEEIRREKEQLAIEVETDVVADSGYYTEGAIIDTKDEAECRPVVSPAAEGAQKPASKIQLTGYTR